MSKMTVYHGGYAKIEKPEIIKGRNTKDFAKVFTVPLSVSKLNAGQDDITHLPLTHIL